MFQNECSKYSGFRVIGYLMESVPLQCFTIDSVSRIDKFLSLFLSLTGNIYFFVCVVCV